MTQYPHFLQQRTVLNYKGESIDTDQRPISNHKRKFMLYSHIAKGMCEHLLTVSDWLPISEVIKIGLKAGDYFITDSTIRNIVYELYQWEVINMRDILIHPLNRTGKRTIKDRLVKLSDNWEGNLKLFLSID